jgi:hypothetical protein
MPGPRRYPSFHLRRASSAPVARVAAAVLAVLLSGAPRVLQLEAPLERHRCVCRHAAGERCSCGQCSRAAALARARANAVARCHRAPAQGPRQERSPQRSAPCIEGACGGDRARALTSVAAIDPFALPTAPASPTTTPSRRVRLPPAASGDADPPEPETPPPRPG